MSWQRIRGHDQIIQSFDHVVRRGRLAHAYLFTGPPGIGKRLFALELAKALLCEGRDRSTLTRGLTAHRSPGTSKLEACDQCASCLLVDAGTHPDLFVTARPEDSLEVPI